MHKSASVSSSAIVFLAASLPCAAPCFAEQDYPARSIRLIVPYPPGGPTDLIGRTVSDLLARRLGYPVIVDNRVGAATVVGTEIAAHSAPDGYTLLVATVTTLAVNPAVTTNLPYHPERDFEPISMLAAQPYLLAVNSSIPASSVSQLVALAKAQPGKLSFASAGVGSGAHLAGEMLKHMAAIDVVHIPYKGTGPAITDLIGGQVAYMFGGISALYPHALSGKLRVFAVSSGKRSPAVPDIPTISESGIPGYQTNSWNSLVAPRATPRHIIKRLNTEVVAVLNQPEVAERLRKQGIDPEPGTPAQLTAHIRSEGMRFRGLIKTIGLTKVE